MRKIKVVQQIVNPSGIGGVASEYEALKSSKLNNEYKFIPVVLKEINKGINIKDIKFYYEEIKKIKPDIIHIRGAAIDGLNAIIAAKLYGKAKIFLAVHGMYSDLVFVSKIKHIISKHLIEPISFYLADGISCVCEEKAKKLNGFRFKMLPVVYNRAPKIDMDLKALKRQKIRGLYNISDNEIVGIYCGRLTQEKGLEYLVKALNNLEEEVLENVRFLIVGDGEYKKKILEDMKNLINDKKVILTGSQLEVKDYLLASDFFVQPSLHENHSIAILEAGMAELPIIATEVGGNSEIINDKECGILIKSKNEKLIEEAIIELVLKKDLREKYGKNARKKILDKFNSELIDKALDSAYKEILERGMM